MVMITGRKKISRVNKPKLMGFKGIKTGGGPNRGANAAARISRKIGRLSGMQGNTVRAGKAFKSGGAKAGANFKPLKTGGRISNMQMHKMGVPGSKIRETRMKLRKGGVAASNTLRGANLNPLGAKKPTKMTRGTLTGRVGGISSSGGARAGNLRNLARRMGGMRKTEGFASPRTVGQKKISRLKKKFGKV